MSKKYRAEARAKQRLQDRYIDGLTEDEAAVEARDWHDEHVPAYQSSAPDRRQDERLPF